MDDVLAEAAANGKPLFISFDIDAIDPAFTPGTATPEPGGLYMREALPIMRRLCAENNVVGVELVEIRPDSDPGYTTMLNTKALLRQCLNGLAVRKAGLGIALPPRYHRRRQIIPFRAARLRRPCP